MAVTLTSNGTDITSSINWTTLVWTSVLTKEVDRLEFSIIKTAAKTIPAVNDDIVLLEDGGKVFGGVVVEKKEVVRGGVLIGYDVKCKDYSQRLDMKLVQKSYKDTTLRAIVLDILSGYTSGFTTTHIPASTPSVKTIKFNYIQVSRAFTDLAEKVGWDWYVDADKDLHFFDTETNPAPFNISDTSANFEWPSLEINETVVNLKNSVFVRGGEYKKAYAAGASPDNYKGDGSRTTFFLAYKYDNITVTVGGVVQVIGTDQEDPAVGVDCLYNFAEKFIRFGTAPGAGVDVVIYGTALIPIVANARDAASIAAYGEIQGVKTDTTITSVEEAQSVAKGELEKYAANVHEGRFKTTTPGLRVGQSITVSSTIRSLSIRTYKINRLVAKCKTPSTLVYDVYLLASGQVTFTDLMVGLLGKDNAGMDIDDHEVVERLESSSETITIGDTAAATKKSKPYKYGTGSANDARIDFATYS